MIGIMVAFSRQADIQPGRVKKYPLRQGEPAVPEALAQGKAHPGAGRFTGQPDFLSGVALRQGVPEGGQIIQSGRVRMGGRQPVGGDVKSAEATGQHQSGRHGPVCIRAADVVSAAMNIDQYPIEMGSCPAVLDHQHPASPHGLFPAPAAGRQGHQGFQRRFHQSDMTGMPHAPQQGLLAAQEQSEHSGGRADQDGTLPGGSGRLGPRLAQAEIGCHFFRSMLSGSPNFHFSLTRFSDPVSPLLLW